MQIIVHTRKTTSIDNEQYQKFLNWDIKEFSIYEKEYSSRVFFRTNPSYIYNCHGLTFASRRTCIHTSTDIYKILEDDNYKEVHQNEVKPGDIITYTGDDGDIEHSGVVISKPEETLKVPMILSKWGRYKEAIHLATICPYNVSDIKYYRILE